MASASSSQSRSEVYISWWTSGLYSNLVIDQILHAEDPKVNPCFGGESLMKDIEDMRIMIITVSVQFLRSVKCMDNLVKVFDQRERGKLIVKPIFYYLDPEKLRAQTGSVGKALALLEESQGVDPKKVKRWREALSELGSLSGWRFPNLPYKTELVQSNVMDVGVMLAIRVVEDVVAVLDDAPMNDIGLRKTGYWPFSSVASPSQSCSQVYISFLNYDVPDNFLNCLIHDVGQKQKRRHINHDDLLRMKFNHSNIEAIEDSQIAIIVFSGDYAYSEQCMKELEKIIECQSCGKLIVRLVTYNVDPWEAYGNLVTTLEIDPRMRSMLCAVVMKALRRDGDLTYVPSTFQLF